MEINTHNTKTSNPKSTETLNSIEHFEFAVGELYLFHKTDSQCPEQESLWAIFDKREQGKIYLESCSSDLYLFEFWETLPAEFKFFRLATRDELRDYTANLASSQS